MFIPTTSLMDYAWSIDISTEPTGCHKGLIRGSSQVTFTQSNQAALNQPSSEELFPSNPIIDSDHCLI